MLSYFRLMRLWLYLDLHSSVHLNKTVNKYVLCVHYTSYTDCVKNSMVGTILTLYIETFLCLFHHVRGHCDHDHRAMIYNYLFNQCLSPLKLWIRIPLRRGVLNTTLCDKVVASQWFSQRTPVSSTNITDPHDIIEILLKVVLNTISITPNPYSLPVLGFPMPYVVGFLCSIVWVERW